MDHSGEHTRDASVSIPVANSRDSTAPAAASPLGHSYGVRRLTRALARCVYSVNYLSASESSTLQTVHVDWADNACLNDLRPPWRAGIADRGWCGLTVGHARSAAKSATLWTADMRDGPGTRRGGGLGLHPSSSRTLTNQSDSPTAFQSIHGFGSEAVAVRPSMDPSQVVHVPAGRSAARNIAQPGSLSGSRRHLSGTPVSSLSAALTRSQPRHSVNSQLSVRTPALQCQSGASVPCCMTTDAGATQFSQFLFGESGQMAEVGGRSSCSPHAGRRSARCVCYTRGACYDTSFTPLSRPPT